LNSEVNEATHTEVRSHIAGGGKFVWCVLQDADQDTQNAMLKAARALETKYGWAEGLIEFRWNHNIATWLTCNPNLIHVHLPGLSRQLQGIQSIEDALASLGRHSPARWVSFGDRESVRSSIQSHLLSKEGPALLHIAGFSGIGKTRTALEACRARTGTDGGGQELLELRGTFYLPRLDNLTPGIRQFLCAEGTHAKIIIDEVSLADIGRVDSMLGQFGERVRVVTLGPALRRDSQRVHQAANVVILPEPDMEEGVLAVIRGAGQGLMDQELRGIAAAAGHDLSLALLLVQATVRVGPTALPLVNLDGIFQRLLALFRGHLGDPDWFRNRYFALTVGIDIGIAGNLRDELTRLADFFTLPEAALARAIEEAVQCGLGKRVGARFFEAVPHALAARLFEETTWPMVRDRFDDFYQSLPPRLQLKFVERCQECSPQTQAETNEALASFFLACLDEWGVEGLVDRSRSRLFQAWAEFDPQRGLRWLRSAVQRTSREALLGLHGREDWSGGWSGRRQLVWLCQNLASFSEHFEDCEDVLFRLALAETEHGIGNNSTAIWQSLFWPVLANTEVPFPDRFPVLMRRLRVAADEEVPLVLSALFGVFDSRPLGMARPPAVVGGRLVPPFWMPQNRGELRTLLANAGRETIVALRNLPGRHREGALAMLIDHLQDFEVLGLLAEARDVLGGEGLNLDLRRRLKGSIERLLAILREDDQGREGLADRIAVWSSWLDELAPPDLPTAIQDLTAQNPWGFARTQPSRYEQLASRLLEAPETLAGLRGWFGSQAVRSGGSFAFALGRLDVEERAGATIEAWLSEGHAPQFVAQYLCGRSSGGHLPERWRRALDANASAQPAAVLEVTLWADQSLDGFYRLMNHHHRLGSGAAGYFQPLLYPEWSALLGAAERAEVLGYLRRCADGGETQADRVGLRLIASWYREEAVPPELYESAFTLFRMAIASPEEVDSYEWGVAAKRLVAVRPEMGAEALADVLFARGPGSYRLVDEAKEALVGLARSNPQAVLSAIEAAIADQGRRFALRLAELKGLFEAIDLPTFQRWVGENRERLLYIARHLASPYLDESGTAVVPPHTAWFLRQVATDDKLFVEFCAGRHHLEVRPAPTKTRQEMEAELAPFLSSQEPRLRDWARYEIDFVEGERRWHAEMDEEYGRT
jgi:hypothetical protein